MISRWCRERLEALEAAADSSGFKPSACKKDERLSPLPVNLLLNLLEVRPARGGLPTNYRTE